MSRYGTTGKAFFFFGGGDYSNIFEDEERNVSKSESKTTFQNRDNAFFMLKKI